MILKYLYFIETLLFSVCMYLLETLASGMSNLVQFGYISMRLH